MPTPPFSAILLAAGRSTRMGRDKALIEIDGVPLWRRQRDILAAAGAAEIFLSARPGQEWVRGTSGFTAVVHDALSTGGPIVGITAGLERATHPWLAVLAIDLPAMTPTWFATLLREVETGVGVVGRRGEFFEPLAAIYPAQLRWLAWEALVRGDFSLQHLLAAAVAQGVLRVRQIAEDESPMFENWNAPVSGGAA